jgi:hypothetical protein
VFNDQSDPGFDCLNSQSVSTWQPLDLTTYVLPVFQIEDMITKLNYVISRGGADTEARINERDNWRAVLKSYRNHSASMMPVFSVSQQTLIAAVNMIMMSSQDTDFELMVDELLATLTRFDFAVALDDILSAFSRLKYVCGESVLRSTSTRVCEGFNQIQWTSLIAALDHVCTNGTSRSSGTSSSILNPTHALYVLCNKRSTFPFLEDTTKYLSFASHSPISMKFTSAVSNHISLHTSFHSLTGTSTGLEADRTINIGGVSTQNEKNQKSTREVTVGLGDNNRGSTI